MCQISFLKIVNNTSWPTTLYSPWVLNIKIIIPWPQERSVSQFPIIVNAYLFHLVYNLPFFMVATFYGFWMSWAALMRSVIQCTEVSVQYFMKNIWKCLTIFVSNFYNVVSCCNFIDTVCRFNTNLTLQWKKTSRQEVSKYFVPNLH